MTKKKRFMQIMRSFLKKEFKKKDNNILEMEGYFYEEFEYENSGFKFYNFDE